ncbi:hypothetical protein [Bacteroides zhangwenhongii]|uniref:RipA family octameric membrane protein n=1 Tax=Bacteroides zhangwenhongii TaxID=2650157 RepID=UPI0022DFB176|nr:hypothetical protein [Bacteroides zhangwenhongii]
MNKIDRKKYYKLFELRDEPNTRGNELNKEKTYKYEEALNRAWKNRDFEIEMYWKRATYFWVFLATTFAGYFALLTVDMDKVKNKIDVYLLELVIISLGICFSLSWFLVNRGSKKWQENWEAHIDILENKVTGPIYKIVKDKKGYNYSVSQINEFVSLFVLVIWIVLLASFLLKRYFLFGLSIDTLRFTIMASALLLTIVFSFLLLKYKKTTNEKKIYSFKMREYEIKK